MLIGLCTFDGLTWARDQLRWHFGTKAKNPGQTVFEHLPPAVYTVERNALTKTGPQTMLMTQCDRQLVTVEPGAEATVRIDRHVGRPLKGHVAGLQDVALAYAHLTIHYFGPEEGIGPSGKPRRQMTALDIIPITSEGTFTTDPIPPGDYWINLFALRADNPEGNQSDFKSKGGQYRFTVPAEGELPPIELTAVVNPHASPARPATSLLRVVGPDGKPVARFEVSLLSSETNVRGWIPGQDGQVSLADRFRLHEGPVVSLVVRAEGFAASITRFAGDELEKLRGGNVTITLDPGQEVELELRLPAGMVWPKFEVQPVVCFESFRKKVWLDWQNGEALAGFDLNLLGPAWPRPGVARLRLTAGSPPFRVSIHARGFLRFFESGPLTLADFKDGRLAVDVPQPGRLDLHFQPVAAAGQELPFEKATFSLMWKLPTGSSGSHLMAGGGQMEAPWGPREVTDLAPGKYRVTVSTKPKDGIDDLALKIYSSAVNPGRFFAVERVSLRAGQTESVKFAYTPFDPDGFRGDRTATLRIVRPDDSAAAGAKLLVTWSDVHYGSLKVFSGEVPESGLVTIEKITARATEEAPEPFTVWINRGESEGRHAGDAAGNLRPGRRRREPGVQLPPAPRRGRSGPRRGAGQHGQRQCGPSERFPGQGGAGRLLGHLVRTLPGAAARDQQIQRGNGQGLERSGCHPADQRRRRRRHPEGPRRQPRLDQPGSLLGRQRRGKDGV